jgi:hypothetical protein
MTMDATVFDEARAEFGEPVHLRDYRVEVFRRSDGIRLVGEVRDTNPQGLNADDPDPLEIHRMALVVDCSVPDLVIEHAEARMHTHPHLECPMITQTYAQLVGMRIGRGFHKQVRELFAGPRGCSHTTALLQAMAPVAWQSLFTWNDEIEFPAPGSPEAEQWRRITFELLRGTCHMFADGGYMERKLEIPGFDLPLWALERAESLGVDLAPWAQDQEIVDVSRAVGDDAAAD